MTSLLPYRMMKEKFDGCKHTRRFDEEEENIENSRIGKRND